MAKATFSGTFTEQTCLQRNGAPCGAPFHYYTRRSCGPRATPFSTEEVFTAARSASPIIEICDNRFVDWRKVSVEEIVADKAFHDVLVVGPEVTGWRTADLAHCKARISIDGTEVGRGTNEPVLGDLLTGLVWVADKLREREQGWRVTLSRSARGRARRPCHLIADYGALG